jgi:hypothetical protein
LNKADLHGSTNKSNTKSTPTLLAGILFMLARHGYEAELKPNRFYMHLTLGHAQPLPSEIIHILRKNGFEYWFLDKVTYVNVDGTIMCRSHFRRPH